MSQTQTWTVGRLLEWTTDYLRQHGSDSPRLDAEVLLAHARQCQRIQLYTAFSEEPDETCRVAFREMVKRRAEGTPVAYLVGHKEFYSLDFIVTPDVLIPRSETEHLVLEAVDCVKRWRSLIGNDQQRVRIADVCTGSGCIAIAIAKNVTNCSVEAFDVSPAALEVAKRNGERHGLLDRAQFIQSDLLRSRSDKRNHDEEPYDLIVSNPPYVSELEFESLPKSVRDHEPRIALVAGKEGMDVIERLVVESEPLLRRDGFLMIEISPMIASQVESFVSSRPAWRFEKFTKDLAGHARIALLKRL